MQSGFMVYDPNGNLKLDMSKQITRIIGELTLNGSGSITSGSINYPNNNLWYMVVVYGSAGSSVEATPVLRIDNSGKRIFWQNQKGTVIRYGIY